MRRRFKHLILLHALAAFFTSGMYAQVLEGKVIDRSKNEGLAYVNIALKGTSLGTVSKFDGSFRIDITDNPASLDSLQFSIIGFEKRTIHIDELSKQKTVYLNPTSVNLESVIVSPKSPEEYIQLAIENIPDNYINEAFNGTFYFNTEIRLNGMFIESTEAIIKGYIMPVAGEYSDTTRLKLLAFKYFDQQEDAIESVRMKKRKKEKLALDGLDTTLIELAYELGKEFGPYTQIDSNLIKQLYLHGYEKGKEKYWFENMVQHEDRDLMKIGFKGRVKMASQRGNLLLDEESLAFDSYNYQIETSNLKIKALLLIMGIGFKKADAIIRFTSKPTEKGWIPDLLDINVFVDMEKNKWFAKDIPIVIELKSHISFLEIDVPATDNCLDGQLIKKGKHLKEQFKSDPNSEAWKEYAPLIKSKKE